MKIFMMAKSVCFTPSRIVWSEPQLVGALIIDLSKLSLHKSHYDKTKPRLGDKERKCYKNSVSLFQRIKTPETFSILATFKRLLVLSHYPKEHFLQNKAYKNVPPIMEKDIQGSLSEIVCLRSKLDAVKNEGGVKQSANGVQRTVKKISHHHFHEQCVLNKESVKLSKTQLCSKGHQNVVNCVRKIAISTHDEKRYLLDDVVKLLTYEHCKTGKKSNEQV